MRFDGKFGFFGGNVEEDETIESTLQRELREVRKKRCVAACRSVLQRVAACCSVLHHVAAHGHTTFNELKCVSFE